MSRKSPPKHLIGFFVYFLSLHKWLVFALCATGIAYGMLTTGTTYMLKLMVDVLADPNINSSEVINAIKYPAIGFIVFIIIEVSNFRLTDYIKLRLIPAIRKDIHSFSFSHLSEQTYSYFQNSFAGNLSNRMSELNNAVVSIVMKYDEMFATFIKLIISASILFYVNIYFGIILLTWSLALIVISALFAKKIIKLSKDLSASKAHLGGIVVDNFANIMNVLSFANRRYEMQLNKRVLEQTVSRDRKMQWAVIFMRLWQDITFIIMFISMLSTSIYFYKNKMITAGDFVLTMNLASSVAQNMWWIANNFAFLSEDLGKCSQAISIINTPIAIKDKTGSKDIDIQKGKIEFHDVTFYYNKNKSLFEDKNITIHPGEKVGLVGFTGSGKSSFVNLIMRFYEPVKGQILIDGRNISEYKLESLRKQIAIIPQDTSLFHRSILENIRYGDVNASDDEVMKAAKDAYCDSFINELPEKYKTLVGERGVKLSGGQRQRIAIARAFLKKAPIIILDEATSALDSVTERKIQNSLDKLTKGKTTIVIAHRLSTLAEMSRILVFENGRIIQDGTHHQLVRVDGHYKELWQMQADGFLPDNSDKAVKLDNTLS